VLWHPPTKGSGGWHEEADETRGWRLYSEVDPVEPGGMGLEKFLHISPVAEISVGGPATHFLDYFRVYAATQKCGGATNSEGVARDSGKAALAPDSVAHGQEGDFVQHYSVTSCGVLADEGGRRKGGALEMAADGRCSVEGTVLVQEINVSATKPCGFGPRESDERGEGTVGGDAPRVAAGKPSGV